MPPRQYSAAPPVPRRVYLELTARGAMDYPFFLRMLDQLRALGVREIGLSCAGDPFPCRWLPEAIRHAKDMRFESVFLAAGSAVARPQPSPRQELPCPSLFGEATITCDGRLSACPHGRDARFDMGDLACETFLECWHDEHFQRLREAHLAKDVLGTPCEGCTAYG